MKHQPMITIAGEVITENQPGVRIITTDPRGTEFSRPVGMVRAANTARETRWSHTIRIGPDRACSTPNNSWSRRSDIESAHSGGRLVLTSFACRSR